VTSTISRARATLRVRHLLRREDRRESQDAVLDVDDRHLLLGNVDARREADVTGDTRKVLRRSERTGNGLLLG
jgi:hypothetical protein